MEKSKKKKITKMVNEFGIKKNGKIKFENNYKDGILYGKMNSYFENGQLESNSYYKNGTLIKTILHKLH
tara:strand:+ start:1887 stop:2093 length:207 start_codon:yes stop_codon:yes gene_type:complete